MAAGETSTLFGLIRGINDRKENARVKGALSNYLTAPEESIRAVNDINPQIAIPMAQDYQSQQATLVDKAKKTQEDDRVKRLAAIRNMAQSLGKVRDSGGDLGAAFSSLTPIFKGGFGMQDDEIQQYGQAILQNPAVLDSLYENADNEIKTVSPGSVLTRGGKEIYRNPAAVRVVQVKGADGGVDVIGVDAEGNYVSGDGPKAAPGNGKSLTARTNNRGALKDGPFARSQPGYKGSENGFAVFATPEAGAAAQERLLMNNYIAKGYDTPAKIVNRYAPIGPENSAASVRNYIGYVSQKLGIRPDQPVPPSRVRELAAAMGEFEGGTTGGGGSSRPIYSKPGKPDEGFRVMTAAEKAAVPGLNPNLAYQVSPKGEIKPISAGPAPKANKNAPKPITPEQQYSTINSLAKVRDEADRILNDPNFNQATGSIQGRIPSIFQGSRNFDAVLQSYKDKVVIGALSELKRNSPNGASGFGSLQLKEGERLENQGGTLDPTAPEELRRTLMTQKKDAQITIGMQLGAPPEATALLLQRPNLAKDYDRKYGAGAARKVLGDRK